jgi:methylase of polypeptide subunit release factors
METRLHSERRTTVRTTLREILERPVRQLPRGRRLHPQLAADSIERVADGRPLRVLDAGAGEGLFVTALACRHGGWTVDAVDLSENVLTLGHRLAETQRVSNVLFERPDATKPSHSPWDRISR